jgi:hypothetical protein
MPAQQPPADAFHVPPLPPGVAVTRWQQFCWRGTEALWHLDKAGEQGWELVSVSVASTGDVAIPNSTFEAARGNVVRSTYVSGTTLVLACFKRPLPAMQPPAR